MIKRVSRQWWFFWLTAASYVGLNVCNTLHTYIVAIGREGWKTLDSFDISLMLLSTGAAMFIAIRALLNGEYNKASNGTVKAGTENASTN